MILRFNILVVVAACLPQPHTPCSSIHDVWTMIQHDLILKIAVNHRARAGFFFFMPHIRGVEDARSHTHVCVCVQTMYFIFFSDFFFILFI